MHFSSLLIAALPLAYQALAVPTARANKGDKHSGIQIFLDFDGTIVTSDAFSTLAYAAYDGLPANSTVPSWDEIEGLYGQVVEASEANLPTPTNINESIALANNELLGTVERWSFLWVQSTGLFDTVKATDLQRYARNVTLRDGWCGFAEEAKAHGVHINILSLNWSPSWLRLILREVSGCPDVLDNVSTYCGELIPAGVLPYSELDNNVPLHIGGDKTVLIKKLLKDIPAEKKEKVVFVTDGRADLQPLWQAPTNIGVTAGNASVSSAPRVLESYNVTVAPAGDGFRGFSGEAGDQSFIYGLENWSELQTLLWG